MSYSVQVSEKAEAELLDIPQRFRRQILGKLPLIGANPRGYGEKLTGYEVWRVRSGDYRILYEIEDQTQVVVIYAVLHRREAYRNLG